MSNDLRIGHLISDQESLISKVPIQEGQIIYSEKSAMQFVDYANKRHTHGSILSGIYNEDTFIDFQTVEINEVLSAIKSNGFIVDGQIIKVGNTVYQYRNVKGKNLIIKMNETGIITDKSKVCYAVYLPDYVEGDSVSIDFLIAITNKVYGDKIYYVKVQDNVLDISQCDDMDGKFNLEEFDISILHNGNGLFTLSTNISSTMNIISCTVSSTGSSIHEEFYIAHSDFELIDEWVALATLPYEFSMGTAAVFNGEIHLLGGANTPSAFYKLSDDEWVSLTSLPFDLGNVNAVVYENAIHIFGDTNHYKWDGTSWVQASTLPYSLNNGCAIIYKDEIHILSGNNHYKWNGNTYEWEEVSTMPFEFTNGCAIVFDNELHIFGETYHYKWNSTIWTSVSELPVSSTGGSAAVYNGVINLYIGENYYKWNGAEWIVVSTLPYSLYDGSVIIYENELHLLGGSSATTSHYKYLKSVK